MHKIPKGLPRVPAGVSLSSDPHAPIAGVVFGVCASTVFWLVVYALAHLK